MFQALLERNRGVRVAEHAIWLFVIAAGLAPFVAMAAVAIEVERGASALRARAAAGPADEDTHAVVICRAVHR